MKKHLYLVITAFIMLLVSSSCGSNPSKYDPLNGSNFNPPCDNTVLPDGIAITLDFSKCYYQCTSGTFGTTQNQPPQATQFNYLHQASATVNSSSLSNADDYLCAIVIANIQPATTPVSPCSNAATQNFTWSKPGSTEIIRGGGFINANQNVTVDYYDVCDLCSGTSRARPHFVGKKIVPAGIPTATVEMQNAKSVYTNAYCQ